MRYRDGQGQADVDDLLVLDLQVKDDGLVRECGEIHQDKYEGGLL